MQRIRYNRHHVYEATYNCLGPQSTPPCPLNNISANTANKATPTALLHSAYRRVSRAFSCLLLAAMPFLTGSCQQDETSAEEALHATMLEYYAESRGLLETSADSVCSYYAKFSSFHNLHPDCEADELYTPTLENLGNAFTRYGIVQIGNLIVKTEWDGETHINF